MGRPAASFGRSKSKYKPNPTVLVLCEDTRSSKRYLEDARLHFRTLADVEIAHCGKTDPLGIVNEAITRSVRYDVVYCVIDRDTHHNYDEAINKCKGRAKIKIIVSHPCFEYWLLLHFAYTARPYVRAGNLSPAEALIRDLRKNAELRDYDKGASASWFNLLLGDRFETAKERALRARADAADRNDPNPSTELDLILREFERLGGVQDIESGPK